MKTIKVVFCKELRRVLFDKKMLFGLFVLPILLMAVIFGVMVMMVMNMQADIEAHQPKVVIVNAPEDFQSFLSGQKTEAELVYQQWEDETLEKQDGSKTGVQQVKKEILEGDTDLMIFFPEDFSEQISGLEEEKLYDDSASPVLVPQVKTYYNPSEDYSDSAKQSFDELLEDYRIMLLEQRVGSLDKVQVFTVDSDNEEQVIQDDDKAGGKMLGTMLPYMICMLLFAGVMSFGADAFAGEKERGTLATLLVAPVKRSHIVYGKLLALMVLAALSALDYGISMLVSLPFMAISMGSSGVSFHISFLQGCLLLAIIVSLVFVYVAIIGTCAVFAKNMKEASTFLTPAYLLVIVMGMMTMFVTGDTPTRSYLVPLYGSSMALRNVLTQEISTPQALLTIGANLVIGAILAAIMSKAFDSERIMFDA